MSLKLDTKYIPLYRSLKHNNNISSQEYNHNEIDKEYSLIDELGAYKIIGYKKDYSKKIGESRVTIDKVYSDFLDMWRELTDGQK